ncbi:Clp protease N-terminal domain-containing protein [Actinocrispum wychmicini]|uniref:ClpA/ClpB-like protein n=1 Tax=Actinocrispum wychmicini TaxID=1213861 RepID=A0A4R2JLU4_9PSEU|nr:Clp protease N-terminal domain-containing protein [Actinocrispum wychmicini]TCO59572.1 ClpA/ClpB-like protein [Actinocrispum wychmicini]
MGKQLSNSVRTRVVLAAMAEARRRGDRRLGTEHLLLGLLHERDSAAIQALGVDLDAARTGLDALDRAALVAIGIDVGDLPFTGHIASGKRPPLTSAARAVLLHAIKPTPRSKARHPTAEHLLLALLAGHQPDPAADLLAQLDIDLDAVRNRLDQP